MAENSDQTSKIRGAGPLDVRNMQVELESSLNDAHAFYGGRISAYEKKINDLNKKIEDIQENAHTERQRLISSFTERQKDFEDRFEALNESHKQREREFYEKDRAYQKLLKEEREHLENQIIKISDERHELERERIRIAEENQENLRNNSSEFVNKTVKRLEDKEWFLSFMSISWSIVGGTLLIISAITLMWLSYITINKVTSAMNWALLSFYALKGAVLVGIVGIASRYAFILSSNYMKEALRTTDRIHAIKFGQLYVETYGAASDWEKIKDAFSNWNSGAGPDWESSKPVEESNQLQSADLVHIIKSVIQK